MLRSESSSHGRSPWPLFSPALPPGGFGSSPPLGHGTVWVLFPSSFLFFLSAPFGACFVFTNQSLPLRLCSLGNIHLGKDDYFYPLLLMAAFCESQRIEGNDYTGPSAVVLLPSSHSSSHFLLSWNPPCVVVKELFCFILLESSVGIHIPRQFCFKKQPFGR
jgi:hypothetical protein